MMMTNDLLTSIFLPGLTVVKPLAWDRVDLADGGGSDEMILKGESTTIPKDSGVCVVLANINRWIFTAFSVS